MDTQKLRQIAHWTLPSGLFETGMKMGFRLLNLRGVQLCRRNNHYRNLHQGKRCFIVCNGPSINNQDLLPLKNEVVFSVSSGYHHKDYPVYKPLYHCTPQITFTEKMTTATAIEWFKEMHAKTGEAELFISHKQEELVRRNNLFPGRTVNYVCMHGDFGTSTQVPNIAGVIPGVNSVSILCIMIAMYMGFKEIYLLGTDHDSFKSREYAYFFKPTVLDGKTEGVTQDNKISDPLCEELYGYYRLFSQYRALRRIAQHNGISLYNATAGGALDELPRVALEDIWKALGYR